MKKDVGDALPGFVGLREFFRRLGDQFEPIVLDDDRQGFYIKKIEELRGFPEDLFFKMFTDGQRRRMSLYAYMMLRNEQGLG